MTLLEMRGITKRFHGVTALSDVNLAVRAGEIHAVVGENGAGKSTLMKVLSGVFPHGEYEGAIHFEGRERHFRGIHDSEQAATVFKDTRELARVTVNMIDALLSGQKVEINDTKTYNNGVKVVPSYLLKPVSVDVSNWKPILIDSGYYKESQIK